MKNLKINLIRSGDILPDINGKNPIKTFVGSIKAKDILNNLDIPEYDPKNPKSNKYQRKPTESRIQAVKNRILDTKNAGDIFVDSINVNLSFTPDEAKTFITPKNTGQIEPGEIYELNFVPGKYFFIVVDGQTRLLGLKEAINELDIAAQAKFITELENTRIQVNFSVTNDILREGYVFYLINKHAKNVPAEGAARMIFNGYKSGNIQFTNEIAYLPNQMEEVEWMDAADYIFTKSPIWSLLVKDYNQKGKNRRITIRALSNSLVSKFYKTVKDQYPNQKGGLNKLIAEVFEAYWEGIGIIFPEFNRSGYTMTKASNAEVMCLILNFILELHFGGYYKLKSIRDPKEYAKLFAHIYNNFSDHNGSGVIVKKKSLWLTGEKGSMGKYTSAAAKKSLYGEMRDVLVTELNKINNVNIPV